MNDPLTIVGWVFMVIFWMAIMSVCIYSNYQVITYLNDKPPLTKTVLDELYIHLFWAWAFEASVASLFLLIASLDIENPYVIEIAGLVTYFAVMLAPTALLASLIFTGYSI